MVGGGGEECEIGWGGVVVVGRGGKVLYEGEKKRKG